jgi:AcrR family transcriptional regulator
MNVFMSGSLTRKKSTRRDALIDAAADLFSTRGFDTVSVSEIAQAADLATGTFYNYFPTKTAVLLEILGADLDAMLAEFGRGTGVQGEPIEALLGIFRVVDRRSRALWRQVVGQAMLDPTGFGRAYADVDARLKTEVETAVARYDMDWSSEEERRTLTDLVFNLGNAFFYEYIADETLTLDEVRDRLVAQLRLVFTGFGRGRP